MLIRITFLLLIVFTIPFAARAAVIQLPRTGQTDCWDIKGTLIDCARTGADGETLKGILWPSARFIDNGDGTLTDKLTDLVWLKETNCFGSITWQQALDVSNALAAGTCDLADGSRAGQWRLPNRKELLSLANYNMPDGGEWLNSQGFRHGQHTYYWSSDTCLANATAYKWTVHSVGAAYPDNWTAPSVGSHFVIPVRNVLTTAVTVTGAITGAHGSISSTNPLTTAVKSAIALTLAADAGYRPNTTVTGTCPPGSFSGNTYYIDTITAGCSVNFSFTPITYTYTINTSTSGSGSIVCTPAGPVSYNTAASCTATPATGNHITGVTVDDENKVIDDPNTFTYPFGAVSADHIISAAFAVNSYTVTFIPGSNGTLAGDACQTVNYGGSTGAVTALPSTGYHLLNWTGENGFATTDNPLMVANVTASQVVTANFSAATHTVTPGTAANGGITPATPQTVSYNDVTSFTVTPDTGYRIDWITGCGGLLNSATYTTGPITADCSVNFSFTPITYTIDTTTSGSGSIACTPAGPVSYNTAASCTVTPATGNHITGVTVDDQNQHISNPNTLTYPFGAVTANHTISAAFAVNSYTVTFIPGSNGSLTDGDTYQPVNYGGSTSAVTALPSTGYHFLNWTGDNGFATTTDNPLTVANVTASQAVTANFSADTHTVTSGTAANGRITPATPQTVSYNGVTSFTVTPDTGYRIASVTGCGGLLNSVTYTMGPITADCSVTFSFTPITYAISTSTSGSGGIACTPSGPLSYNTAVSCTATPATGNHITRVTVDGQNKVIDDPITLNYPFGAVTANHTISVAFAVNSYTVTFIPGSNGTLTGSAGQTVNYGGSTSAVTALPSTGYHLVNWTGDIGFATTNNPLTVANVTASRTVTANFAADMHTVTPGTAANGRLTPATPQTVSDNGATSFTVTPDTGYRIASVTGCGGLLNSATYTTGSITADCSISATFAADPPATYAISGTSPDGNGAISCPSAVTSGGPATCTITLQPGFQLATLTDNGTDSLALVSNNIYTITNVTGNHTVAATFTANTYTIEEILQEYKSVEGKVQLPGSEKTRCDIAPLGVDGKPRPDGTVDVADLIIMLRKLVGVISW